MKDNNERELEKLIGEELSRLPDASAPETLVHRVMLAVHQRERRPWWQRPWLSWPPGFQLASVVVLAAAAGLVAHFAGMVHDGLVTSPVSRWRSESAVVVASVNATLKALGLALSIILQTFGQSLVLGMGVALVSSYLVCVALGTACLRLAFNRS